MESYDAIYVIGNLFMTFVIYKYIHIFYSKSRVRIKVEKVGYIGYFILITCTYNLLKIPIIVMVANLVFLFLITFLYEGTLKKSILTVVIIYFSLMIVETLFVFFTSNLNLNLFEPFAYKSGIGVIAIKITSFVLVLLMQGFKNVKNKVVIPNVYWISLIVVPLGTVTMLFVIFMNTDISSALMVICMSCVLLINIMTFYLYDKISNLMMRQRNKQLEAMQNDFYKQQVEMMKKSLDSMKVIQHDLKNKLSPLYGLAQNKEWEELLKQLSELTSLCNVDNEIVRSGNIVIDSIINYKLNQVKNGSVSIYTDVLIPEKLSLSMFDIAVIVGNLLDNAIEAVLKVEKRWIDIKLKYIKGMLIIEINNSYNGKLIQKAKSFVSVKKDKDNCGMGIRSVRSVVDKYDGVIQFSYDDSIFGVKTLLYI